MAQGNQPSVFIISNYPMIEHALQTHLRGYYQLHFLDQKLMGLHTLVHQLSKLKPTVLILDSGVRVAIPKINRVLQQISPRTACLYIDAELSPLKVSYFLEQGFQGYLYMGDEFLDRLKIAVDSVARGERFVTSSVLLAVQRLNHSCQNYGNLTPKLQKTLQLMVLGYNVREIADLEAVEVKTVYRWQQRLREKFEVETNQELITWVAIAADVFAPHLQLPA